MRGKQKIALLLAVLMLCLSLPTLAAGSGFTDIADSQTAQNVEVLRTMGVIDGISSTQFAPNGTLTRAQFTKMAIMVMGKGNLVEGYRSYTIFPDVRSSHWASGYINLAVRGEDKFIAGFADGTFGPEKNITYGQAVTILMRLLGYKDTDVGAVWPTGYLNSAAACGLTNGVTAGGNDAITRGQASQLFVNLLNTAKKDGAVSYGESVASGAQKSVILLDASAKTESGAAAVETTTGVVKLANGYAPTLLQGRRGTLLLDSRGDAWTFVPDTVGSTRDITVSTAKAGSITDQNGREYTLTANTKAFYKGEETTYGEVFVNLRSGTRVTLHFGVTGKIESLYVAEIGRAHV